MLPVPYPMAWKEDAFHHWWDDLSIYISPFTLLRQVLSRVLQSHNLSVILVALLWPQKDWFTDFVVVVVVVLVEEPLKLFMLWELLVHPHLRNFHGTGVAMSSLLETIKRFVFKARFSKKFIEVSGPRRIGLQTKLFSNKHLIWKVSFHLAVTSVKRVSEPHGLLLSKAL